MTDKDRERGRVYREANREREKERHRAYRAAHPGEDRRRRARRREEENAADRAWREKNAEKVSEYKSRSYRKHIEAKRQYDRAYRAANADALRSQKARRSAMKAGALRVDRIISDLCGVCRQPLTDARWPAAMSTTVGHEPPLSRCAGLAVTERPEHWVCNQRKGTKLDSELEIAA